MQKNETVILTIEDMSTNGEGIGKAEGYPLFVKDTVIGDVAEVKVTKAMKNYGFGRLMKILTPSVHRIEAPCPVARQCGGCQLQAMRYEEQLAFKNRKVKNNLMRIGGIPEELLDEVMEPICGMEEPFRYRNKAQFPVGKDKDGKVISGFYAGRTHQIIPCADCLLGIEENKEIMEIILAHMERYHIRPYDEITGKGLVRHVLIRYGFVTGEIMVCLVLNGHGIPHSEVLVESLCRIPGMKSITINVNREKTNVIMGKEIRKLWGQEYITDSVDGIQFQISPLSFFQVNPIQMRKLYGTALEYAELTGKETVWDLYCGIGTISLFLAQRAGKVYGVEIVPDAIRDAKTNAQINNITNAEFFVGKAEVVLPKYYEDYEKMHPGSHAHADVIVVDPPRKGCEESLLKTIADMHPDRIVYVSCDSATLARDLKYLRGRDYELERVKATDMFPMSSHVETVCLLTHNC